MGHFQSVRLPFGLLSMVISRFDRFPTRQVSSHLWQYLMFFPGLSTPPTGCSFAFSMCTFRSASVAASSRKNIQAIVFECVLPCSKRFLETSLSAEFRAAYTGIKLPKAVANRSVSTLSAPQPSPGDFAHGKSLVSIMMGRKIENDVPMPGSVYAFMSPPYLEIRAWVSASPIPDPSPTGLVEK